MSYLDFVATSLQPPLAIKFATVISNLKLLVFSVFIQCSEFTDEPAGSKSSKS